MHEEGFRQPRWAASAVGAEEQHFPQRPPSLIMLSSRASLFICTLLLRPSQAGTYIEILNIITGINLCFTIKNSVGKWAYIIREHYSHLPLWKLENILLWACLLVISFKVLIEKIFFGKNNRKDFNKWRSVKNMFTY